MQANNLFVVLQRFYQTLSEIKSEIECIIVTGRKLVEDKAIPESDKFSKRIDMLKELYNKVFKFINFRKEYIKSTIRIFKFITAWSSHNGIQIHIRISTRLVTRHA